MAGHIHTSTHPSIHPPTLGLATTGAASDFCVLVLVLALGRSLGLRSRVEEEEEEGSLLLPGAGEAALALHGARRWWGRGCEGHMRKGMVW